MLRPLRFLIGLTASVVLAAPAAHAERRVALVIGNSAYVHANVLRNPKNDASDIAATLTKLGFEVALGLDLDQRGLADKIGEFTRELEGADVGLFYYAGHALQINEKNYLVSTTAKLESEFLISSETMELEPIIRLMESRAPTNLVFLDACRNNPLADNLRRSLVAQRRSANLGRGLARIEATGHDTLIAYSAAPGQEAADGTDRNSPFTAALLKHLPTPALEVSVMLKEVAADVRRETRNAQRPQQLSDMTRVFYFAGASAPAAGTAVAAVQPGTNPITKPDAKPEAKPEAKSEGKPEAKPEAKPAETSAGPAPASADRALDVAFWNSVQSSNDCDSVRAYLRRFPDGIFVELAKLAERRFCGTARRMTIEPGNGEAALDMPPPPTLTPATAPPVAAAPAMPAPAPETPPPETPVSPPSPEVAMLPPPDAAPAIDEGDLARNIQLELIRLGCSLDDADGRWGPATRQAIRNFNRHAGANLDPDQPTTDLIAALRERNDGRVCPPECGRGFRAHGDTCVATTPEKPRGRERSRARERREAARPPAARHSSPQASARPAAKPEFASPLCQTRIQVAGGKWCCTYDPLGGAPRIICN